MYYRVQNLLQFFFLCMPSNFEFSEKFWDIHRCLLYVAIILIAVWRRVYHAILRFGLIQLLNLGSLFSRGVILSYHILVYYVIFPDCASEHTSSLFWKISKSDGILKLTYLVFNLFKKSVFLFIRVPGTCSHASEKSWKMSQNDRGKYI